MRTAKLKLSLFLMSLFASFLIACSGQASKNERSAGQSEPELERAEVWPHPIACAGGVPFTLAGYDRLDPLTYINALDGDAARATAPLEAALLAQFAHGEILAPVVKRYCQMGATQMVVEITHPVEDDSVMAMTMRAIYEWRTDAAGTGWQIADVGIRKNCAREREKDDGPCL
jgi:hypothetical protein